MNAPMIYELRKPKKTEENKVIPAIFVMHGVGSNEQNMLSLVEGLEDSFYIFSIRGQLPHPPGYSFFTIEVIGKPNREEFTEGVDMLSSLIDYACAQYPIDQSRLYVSGFSQGAIMALSLGLRLGNRLKGVIALSGYIPTFLKDETSNKSIKQLSVFISHGELDERLPFAWGIENEQYYREKGANVTFKTYQVGHMVSLENQQDFHQWLRVDSSQ